MMKLNIDIFKNESDFTCMVSWEGYFSKSYFENFNTLAEIQRDLRKTWGVKLKLSELKEKIKERPIV